MVQFVYFILLAGDAIISFGRKNMSAIGVNNLGPDLNSLILKLYALDEFSSSPLLCDNQVECTNSNNISTAYKNVEEILNFDTSKMIITSSFDERCGKRSFHAYRIDSELEQELKEQQHMSNSPEIGFDEER